jgi:hypothetical protein
MTVMAAATRVHRRPPDPAPVLEPLARAARELGLRPRFLIVLEDRGQIKLVRIGRRILVPRAEIDRIARDGAPIPEGGEA